MRERRCCLIGCILYILFIVLAVDLMPGLQDMINALAVVGAITSRIVRLLSFVYHT
jgi:hypothetical protein